MLHCKRFFGELLSCNEIGEQQRGPRKQRNRKTENGKRYAETEKKFFENIHNEGLRKMGPFLDSKNRSGAAAPAG
jgi:hypothetical protein